MAEAPLDERQQLALIRTRIRAQAHSEVTTAVNAALQDLDDYITNNGLTSRIPGRVRSLGLTLGTLVAVIQAELYSASIDVVFAEKLTAALNAIPEE